MAEVYKIFAYCEAGEAVMSVIGALLDEDGQFRWEIHSGRTDEELMFCRCVYPRDYPEGCASQAVADFNQYLGEALKSGLYDVEPFVD